MSLRKPASPSFRVLLVDDVADGNTVRKLLLEEIGMAVETALTAEDGLALFERCPHDLVITDFRLPKMNGAELIHRIRQSGHATRVILLTGLTVAGLNEENTGADVVLWKCSKEAEQLQRTAKSLLSRRPRRKPVGSVKTIATASVARSG